MCIRKQKIFTVRSLLVLLILVFAFHCVSEAIDNKGKIGIGLNYPGVGIRYGLTKKFTLEAKGQFGSDISLGGLRVYYNFKSPERINLFGGLEGDYVNFKGEKSEGTGYVTEVFLGGEYFTTKRLALQLDFGPAFISLTDKNTQVKQEGVEYVVNFGINYYFGGAQ
mgnify:CR=1 FL=1